MAAAFLCVVLHASLMNGVCLVNYRMLSVMVGANCLGPPTSRASSHTREGFLDYIISHESTHLNSGQTIP